jgi:hypothetical protein
MILVPGPWSLVLDSSSLEGLNVIEILLIRCLRLLTLVACQDDSLQNIVCNRPPETSLSQQRVNCLPLGPFLLLGHFRKISCCPLAPITIFEFDPNPVNPDLDNVQQVVDE